MVAESSVRPEQVCKDEQYLMGDWRAMARSFTEKMEDFASMNQQNSSIFTAAKIVGENIQDLLYAME